MTKIKYILSVLVCLGLFSYSCTEDRDKHYDRSDALPDKNLYEIISEDANLSSFAKLVEIAAYDELLTSAQTLTVFAPINSDFTGLNLNSVTQQEARLIVGNHIARFNNSSTTPQTKLVRTIARKIYSFSDGGTYFGNSKLTKSDVLAKNGILHVLETQIPYKSNLYEYITTNSNTSKLAEFITRFDEERFNEELSIPIDIDEHGRTVYDTITTVYNRLFDDPIYGLGVINTEDSLYTMLVPTNNAWDKAYERITPSFKLHNQSVEYADSVQSIQTSLAILENLIYRGEIDNPASRDSLISTAPGIIYNTSEMFSETEKLEASNGLIFQAEELMYDNRQTWNRYIGVEADLASGRTTGANTAIYTRTVDDDVTIPITEKRYIEVQPTTTSAQPAVTFEIPQVLAGMYDIYVEFIPAVIDGTPNDSTKLLFELTYMNENGRSATRLVNTADLVTSGTEVVKMKVLSEFNFPVSNYYDRLWFIDYMDNKHTIDEYVVPTKLMIRTNVSTTEINQNKFTRKFRIDRIIFEPVEK